MKYNVGDKVRIKPKSHFCSVDDFNNINMKDVFFNEYSRLPYCETVMTIGIVNKDFYILKEDRWAYKWTDEMIECKVEEETLIENIDDNGLPFNEWLSYKGAFHVPENYVLKDENGNEILTSKIILEKKKEYPKTYEECCKIIHSDPKFYVDTHLYSGTLGALYKLFICRDAYWKIAGEELGLDGPWEPDWSDEKQDKYGFHNEVQYTIINSAMFVFPTKEMQDAFRENFDSDIEICKNLS